jgi:photosystem II stability/assembly factor-like uncharacterized protein
MADIQFDIALKNTGSVAEGLTLFSPVVSASQKANKYSFATPFTASYTANTVFTLIDDAGTNEITLTADLTMAQVIILLNGMNAGTFILAFNDAINGNVFHLLSVRNPISLSINTSTFIGTFVLVDTGISLGFAQLVFPGASSVIIPDTQSVQLSLDNGDSYTNHAVPSSAGYSFYQFSFIDANNGFLAGNNGANGRIWSTVDGGITWILVNTFVGRAFYSLWMFDALNGVAYVNDLGTFQIETTSDGGSTFISTQIIGTLVGLKFQFLDSLTGFLFESGSGTELLKTVDGGASWTIITFPSTNVQYGSFALDVNNIWIAGSGGVLQYTSDGGTIWTDIGNAFDDYFTVFAFSANYVIVGETGHQYAYTLDGGSNWTTVLVSPGGVNFLLNFRDEFMGVAQDASTEIYKYS